MKGEEERRIVTVLFADIVGFTRLAEDLDPEEVKHRVDGCFDRLATDIASFGGVVDKILGDGIVALFGAPVAHEDDAERAVRAGMHMQETLSAMATEFETPFRMRVGINTGEVLVGASAAGRDYTAMGDVVNSAARLQSLAAPGQVLVGAATELATRDAISYRSLGDLEVKGREEALGCWEALSAVRPPGARTRRSVDFVGRERELELLHAQARLAVDLSQAQMATIFGEAGAGKTRLVEEAAGQLQSRYAARVFEGRCVPYGEANVWWPIADVIRHAFGLQHDSSEDEAGTAIDELLVQYLGGDDPDLARFRIALLHVLGFLTPLRGGDRIRNRAEVTLAVTRILEVELRQRPVVIVLSDVHWAAEAVWGLLRHLLSDLSRARLIVLVTARRSETTESAEGRFGTLEIELGPLDIASSHQLAEALGVDLPADEVAQLIDRSGGNPFFLEELVGLVGVSGRAGATGTAEDGGGLDQLPDTLRGILAARLDRLDLKARQLLESAAVLGRTGTVSGLARMCRETNRGDDISADLAALEADDLLRVTGGRYVFMSDLVREVAYGTITKTARAQLHAGIASFRESGEGNVRNSTAVAIATHYGAAAALLTDLTEVSGLDTVEIQAKALHWTQEAAWRALAAGVPGDAAEWFGVGLDLASDDQSRAQFLYGRAKARCEIRDFAGTRADLESLEPFLQYDPALAAKALVVSGDIDQKAGYLDRAAAQLREASDRLDDLGETSDHALALRLLGMTEMFRGDEPMALRALHLSRQVAASSGNRREEAWATQSLAWFAFRTGRVNEASAFVEQAEEIFSDLDDRGGLAWTRGVAAWVAFHAGDWDRARALVAEVLPETRRRGDPWAEAIMLGLESSMALWSGDAALALELAQQTQTIAERADDLSLAVQARALEGRALISRGRIAEGLVALEQSFALSERTGDAESRRLAVISNCSASARLGDADRAIRWAARFDGNHDDPNVVGESDLSVSLTLAMLQRGAVDEAASQASWSGSFGGEAYNMNAEAVGALVAAAQGDLDLVVEKTNRVFSGPATYLDRTMANLSLAAAACRSGMASEIDEHLAEARRLVRDTDDRLTPLLIDLVSGVCGRSSLPDAEAALRVLAVDPSGWRQAWMLAADSDRSRGAVSSA
ncbi:MAG: class 3 adenylate cyclase/tetratricopeptide (TPR) repeat protein [Acidimicrobiales bacterium]|jgi:class 3 adenylate cyclase/tetratricopeptide (TPR) repeat protein